MTRASVPPFLVPIEDSVRSVAWHRIVDDVPSALEADDWDPATDLRIRASIAFDPTRFRESCGMDSDDELLAILCWADSATRIRGASPVVPLQDGDSLVLEAVIPGSQVAGRLDLRAAIVVARAGRERRFVASDAGAILWSAEESVNLAGTATRFPVEVVDFGDIPARDPKAPWFLDWDPQAPDMPVLGGLRLQLNARSARVVEAVQSSSAGPESAAIREFVAYDVARLIVQGALAHWHADDLRHAEPSTVGALVKRLLDTIFAGRSFEALQQQHSQNPGEVESQIAGSLGTLAGASRVSQ